MLNTEKKEENNVALYIIKQSVKAGKLVEIKVNVK